MSAPPSEFINFGPKRDQQQRVQGGTTSSSPLRSCSPHTFRRSRRSSAPGSRACSPMRITTPDFTFAAEPRFFEESGEDDMFDLEPAEEGSLSLDGVSDEDHCGQISEPLGPVDLPEESPCQLRFRRLASKAYQALLLVMLILLSAHVPLVKARAAQSPFLANSSSASRARAASSAVSVSSLIVGLSYLVLLEGTKACREVFEPRDLMRMALPSLLFLAAQTLQLSAYEALSTDICVVVDRAGLVLCAVLSATFLDRHYSAGQWAALFAATLGMMAFVWTKRLPSSPGDELEDHSPRLWAWACLVGCVFCSSLGSVSSEVLLKNRRWQGHGRQSSFALQRTQMEVPSALVCLVINYVQGASGHQQQHLHEEIAMWDVWTQAMVLIMVLKAWMCGLVVKRLNAVVLNLTSTLATVLACIEAHLIFGEQDPAARLSLASASTLAVVSLAVLAFALVQPNHHPSHHKPRKDLLAPLLPRKVSAS